MLISLEEAQSISSLTVFGLGIGLVFVGLICIIILCAVMGAICKAAIKDKPASAPATTKKAETQIANRGEFIAAVSAAIAEEMGTDISGIRILSVKKL